MLPVLFTFSLRLPKPRRCRLEAVLLGFGLMSALTAEEWKVPSDAESLANPVTATEAAIAAGHRIYVQSCQSCHGGSGKGDGDGATYLSPKPSPLDGPAVSAQSDGAMFFKISTGRNSMPKYRPGLTDEQRWQLVLFLRSLHPQSRPASSK